MESISGIYKIENTVNGNFYIGSAVNLSNRKWHHVSDLRLNRHKNKHLQNAWNKYGEDCFVFSVVEYCEKDRIIEREQFYLDTMQPQYNISPTAGNCLGVKHTEEMRAKVSFAVRNRTPETIEKMSKSHKGVKLSPETRKRISEAQKKTGNVFKMIASNIGRICSPEKRKKISEKNKGKVITQEQRNNLLRTGIKHTEETKAKISASLIGNKRTLGYKHTPEAIEKIREASKRKKKKKIE